MRTGPTLVLTDAVHKRLQAHLLPGDGLEAAAILLCTRMETGQIKLLCRDIVPVPHDQCNRIENHLMWPGDFLEIALDRAEAEDLSLILIHSHPGGFYQFSETDDNSDEEVIPSLFKNRESHHPGRTVHGSAIIIPGGAIKARLYDYSMNVTSVELVAIYGDDVHLYWDDVSDPKVRPMAFTGGMRHELSRLTIAVIGYSGTGSVTAEQLARMGVGSLIVVDFDHVEGRNLNRILNSSIADAKDCKLKVEVFRKAAETYRPDLNIQCIPKTIASREAILSVAQADIIFCCVDSQEGRLLSDLMAAAFMQPLFDIGVVIPVRVTSTGQTAIMDINGRIDYIQPGGTTLFERGVYTSASLTAEELLKRDPEAYAEQVNEGYMPGSIEEAPSVISVNMFAASTCVQEFISRLYPYRLVSNRGYARTVFSLADNEYEYLSDDAFVHTDSELLGSGLKEPLLGIPSLGYTNEKNL
jgi:hypothetical protein